jgi:heme/copper-type cytochrome/quinol oxidase subunit 2
MISGGIKPKGSKGIVRALGVGALSLIGMGLFGSTVLANPEPGQLNLTPGVTTYSNVPYMLNNVALGVCVVIGILVFGAMFIAMFRFRKSRGAVAEKWAHNTTVEIIWTVIPIIILITLAWLATDGLRQFSDTTGAQMTVKVTGYQWKWRYDYVDYQGKAISNVGFLSKLDDQSNATRQLNSGLDPYAVKVGDENVYLLNVDKPLVVPVDTKIRFVITGRRRDPLLVHSGTRLEDGCDPGRGECDVDQHQGAGRVSRPVRRVVRSGSWLHADRGEGCLEGRFRQVAGRSAEARYARGTGAGVHGCRACAGNGAVAPAHGAQG